MNYGALLQDSLEDPTLMIQKKSFGIAFLKKWYSLFASVFVEVGWHQRALMQAHAVMILAYALF